jgi:hypothetical protein
MRRLQARLLVKPEETDHLCNSVEGRHMYPAGQVCMPQGYNQVCAARSKQESVSVHGSQSAFGILLARYKNPSVCGSHTKCLA